MNPVASVLALVRATLRAADAAGSAVTVVASPWLALAVRLWLAQAVVLSGILMMMAGGSGAPGLRHAFLHDASGSVAAIAVHALGPVLLAVGLVTRPVALGLLLVTLFVPEPDRILAPDIRLFWVALLGLLAVNGPGGLSLDRVLRRGIESSALPGARTAPRAAAWITRHLGSPYQLGLRLWAAVSLAGLAGAASGLAPPAAMLAPVPSMLAAVPGPVALALAAAIAAGFATRAAAIAVMAAIPFSVFAGADARPYWLLLLAVFVVRGAGAWSADALLTRLLARRRRTDDGAALPHVVVVGGGFGGIAAVRALRHVPARVTLIDRHNFHLFQPLLYQVATAGLAPGDIATPIRGMLRGQTRAKVRLAQVTGVDVVARAVLIGQDRVPYDYLVLATGARHSYFGNDEWAPLAPGLKDVADGLDIRRRLLTAFEEAESATDPEAQRAWLTFVIVGGGPTGVELAGAIAELARHGLEGEFRSIDPAAARVVLVQSGPRLLPAFPETLSREAARELARLGVEVRLDQKVEAVLPGHVTISGADLPARTVLWAAGVMASPAAAWLGVAADRAGRVPVRADLSVADCTNVFAVGDTAASASWDGKPAPGLAPAARQGGAYVASVIAAHIAGRTPPKPFRYRHYGNLATIGRQAAVADFGAVRLRGAIAWWLWGVAHIAFLVGGRNRATVLLNWFWAYVSFRRGTRLITGPTHPALD